MTKVVSLVADTHVHLYPCYDLAAALESLAANLARLAARSVARAAFFAERGDCRFFRGLRGGSLRLAGGLEVRPLAEEGAAVLLAGMDAPALHLFAGRQVVSAERIEILALATAAEFPDGLPAVQAVQAILGAGGVPVVGWSPGKWWWARGRLVRGLLQSFEPGAILLGDTALRPAPSPAPRLMDTARHRGFSVIAGTDPLPLRGEERLLGTYATAFLGPFDPARPLESARRLLRSPAAVAGVLGTRSSWAISASRWTRLALAPRAAA